MENVEIKNRLVEKIQQIEDPRVLREICRLLEVDLEDDVYAMNEGQKEAVDVALKEIEEGNTLTEEEANEQITRWLNQKE